MLPPNTLQEMANSKSSRNTSADFNFPQHHTFYKSPLGPRVWCMTGNIIGIFYFSLLTLMLICNSMCLNSNVCFVIKTRLSKSRHQHGQCPHFSPCTKTAPTKSTFFSPVAPSGYMSHCNDQCKEK